ncbi:ABC transporter permease [Streptomyces sp. NBC_00576]|uniref:ABC transporter permease n=1 Tax=Streptomyces sp. NBC_00576 TaxID=2903665 RepID=UPI002E8191BC|nr:ABC transporter permease [Streptomyces sp. NBC_00576]WUB76961.1 ABC transporter permease [Streptomyces sp. NBC_00576]
MKRWWSRFRTAMRFALIEQARNRLALLIVVLFVPLWTTLAFEVVAGAPLRFYVRPVGRFVVMDGNILTQVTGALQALTLVVGFMMFVATARSEHFDRRLVQAGYPRSCLALAKCSSLVLVAAAVAVYATAWMHLFWRPVQPAVFAAGMFTGALIYGGIGIALAAVVRSELAGMFLTILISSIDLLLQNPLINANADSDIVRYLPAHGAVQTAMAAAGLHVMPWSCLLLGTGWALATTGLGMTASAARTRTYRTVSRTVQGPRPGETETALVS